VVHIDRTRAVAPVPLPPGSAGAAGAGADPPETFPYGE
jgi:hypothetical protein